MPIFPQNSSVTRLPGYPLSATGGVTLWMYSSYKEACRGRHLESVIVLLPGLQMVLAVGRILLEVVRVVGIGKMVKIGAVCRIWIWHS